MNQTFNFSRFLKYAGYQFGMHKKMIGLGIIGAFSALLLFQILILRSNVYRWRVNEWQNTFFIIFCLGACLIIGHAFPSFRQKEKAISALMLPASIFEKYIYEYILRIVLYIIIFPIIFSLAAKLSTSLIILSVDHAMIASFSLSSIFEVHANQEFLHILLPLIFFTSSAFLFAGSTAFNKYPLVKTIIFLAFVFALGGGYFYLLMVKLNLKHGIGYLIESSMIESEENALKALYILLVACISIALTYAFFKLKEKEI